MNIISTVFAWFSPFFHKKQRNGESNPDDCGVVDKNRHSMWSKTIKLAIEI